MPTWAAMLMLAAGTVLGVIFTLIAGQEPGNLLGSFVIVAAIAAALGILRGKVYLLFPAPALAFFVSAVVTGKVHDAKLGSSTAGLGAGFTQWIAGVFFPAVLATIIVVLIGGGRWLLGRQLITGRSPLSEGRPVPGNARSAPGARRPAVDSWAGDNPFDGPAPRSPQTGPAPRPGTGPAPRQGTGPAPRQGNAPRPGGSNGARPSSDQRSDRDPRLPADRSQPPTGPRPQVTGPGRPAPQPRTPRPSWSPAPNPSRPARRQPPEGWTQR